MWYERLGWMIMYTCNSVGTYSVSFSDRLTQDYLVSPYNLGDELTIRHHVWSHAYHVRVQIIFPEQNLHSFVKNTLWMHGDKHLFLNEILNSYSCFDSAYNFIHLPIYILIVRIFFRKTFFKWVKIFKLGQISSHVLSHATLRH